MELTKFETIAKLAIEKINSLSDVECLSCKNIFLSFEELIGKTVPLGYKFTYQDKLYKTRQDNLLIQEQYIPSINTASLYEEINEKNQGSLEDPIPYNNNMALEEGLYYTQYDVIYKCTRSTGVAVFNDLKDLVNIYVVQV